ncbi:hypothetical protein [Kutzneria buriramensis]|uniref:Uncharacterized protein n=1 Tax=Kutzneria buriramensis TaxID=1045776 RepID=A0A3E0IAJ0_9PSEU|nr:hypothetical protein [Kutzneria buriramensis]REH55748.1 hypothetical protein BCF44_101774 [Kutzneria buriramensis]
MTRTSRPVVIAVVAAALVLVAALGTTVVMRQLRSAAGESGQGTRVDAGPATPEQVQLCGQAACVKLASVSMPQFKETVELLADGKGQSARLRITSDRGTVVFSSQIPTVVGKSITCEEGKTSACLLQGPQDGGVVGEVYVDKAGAWSQTAMPFGSDAGYLALRDVDGDGTPDVVTVQRRCGDNPAASCTKVVADVFQLTGDEVGCSAVYARPQDLPGWPEVAPSKLSECSS